MDADELAEARASFAVLAPRREGAARSIAATLMLGFPDEVRDRRLAILHTFPDQLRLELSDGSLVEPPWTAAPPGRRTVCPRCWPCAT